MRRLFWFVTAFGLGTILGPLLVALVLAALPSGETGMGSGLPEKEIEVGKLLAIYRARLPAGRLFMTVIPPPDGEECGYLPSSVFPTTFAGAATDRLAGRWNPYVGYYALHRWRNDAQADGYIAAISKKMTEDLSKFEAKFLRICIESTVLSGICSRKIESYGDGIDRFSKDYVEDSWIGGNEDRVVCSYVDGVAARKGLPLSKLFDGKFEIKHWRAN